MHTLDIVGLNMKLRIKEILNEKGKTKYWLYIQLGLSYQNFNRIVNNETTGIKFDNLLPTIFLMNITIRLNNRFTLKVFMGDPRIAHRGLNSKADCQQSAFSLGFDFINFIYAYLMVTRVTSVIPPRLA